MERYILTMGLPSSQLWRFCSYSEWKKVLIIQLVLHFRHRHFPFHLNCWGYTGTSVFRWCGLRVTLDQLWTSSFVLCSLPESPEYRLPCFQKHFQLQLLSVKKNLKWNIVYQHGLTSWASCMFRTACSTTSGCILMENSLVWHYRGMCKELFINLSTTLE